MNLFYLKSTICKLLLILIVTHFHPVFTTELDLGFIGLCLPLSCPNIPVNKYEFVLEELPIAPDNYLQTGKLINGQFPGPTIRMHTKEILYVKVFNKLSTNVTIHWHGIYQTKSVQSDGVPGFTQNSIPPNQTYVYYMYIDNQPGTYIYHAHTAFDIVWINGALIIEEDTPYLSFPAEYQYDDDRIIILNEIFHTSVDVIFQSLINNQFVGLNFNSLAINGASYGIWPENNANSSGYSVISVQKGKTYRFRIINLTAQRLLRFSIDGHSMYVFEMDAILIKPVLTDHVDIYTGQRYSVLVTMNNTVNNYWMRSVLIPGPGPSNGLAILHYEHALDPTPLRTLPSGANTIQIPLDTWILPQLYPNMALNQLVVYPIPKTVDKKFFIDTQLLFVNNTPHFYINGHQYVSPDVPYLTQVRHGINLSTDPQVYEIISGQTIQFVIQNRASRFGCELHPWHFHGREFYLIATGPDEYNELKSIPIIRKNGKSGKVQFRDTFIQYPSQTTVNNTIGAGCGWDIVRFKAQNAGMWLAHCHITDHLVAGKRFVVYEHTKNNPRLIGE